MKYSTESFSQPSIFRQMAHFITADSIQLENPRYTSLIWTSHHQTLKPIELCLKLRQALQQVWPNQSCTVEFVEYNPTTNAQIICQSKTNSVTIFYLPKSYFSPMKPPIETIGVGETTEKGLPASLQQECLNLAQNCSTSHCSIVLWNPHKTEESEAKDSQPYINNLTNHFFNAFPQIHFAQVIAQTNNEKPNSIKYLAILKQLLAVLRPNELAYFLKGWRRPELKAKGLAYHPALGSLANQEIEIILELCQKLSAQELSTRKLGSKPNLKSSPIPNQLPSQLQCILQPSFKAVAVNVPNSNAPACPAENHVANG